jgi:hypothetical protein
MGIVASSLLLYLLSSGIISTTYLAISSGFGLFMAAVRTLLNPGSSILDLLLGQKMPMGANMDADNPVNEGNSGSGYNSEGNAPDKPLDKGKGKAVSPGTGGNSLPNSFGIPGLDAEALRFIYMDPSQLNRLRKQLGMLDTPAKANTAEVIDRLFLASFYVDNTLGIKQPDERRSLIAQRYMQIVTRSR